MVYSNNLIISNSSFSTSAAMLGMYNQSCKNIIAPKQYYTYQYKQGALAHHTWDLVDN